MTLETDVRVDIEDLTRQMTGHILGGNAAAIALLYAPDAIMQYPAFEFVRGRAAIATAWQNSLSVPVYDLRVKTYEVTRLGEDARQHGRTFVRVGLPGAAEPVHLMIEFTRHWKRYDQDWKLALDVYNTARPYELAGLASLPASRPARYGFALALPD